MNTKEKEIHLRCKTCNKLLSKYEIKGELSYETVCPRCKNKNIGYITSHK